MMVIDSALAMYRKAMKNNIISLRGRFRAGEVAVRLKMREIRARDSGVTMLICVLTIRFSFYFPPAPALPSQFSAEHRVREAFTRYYNYFHRSS